MDLTIFTLGILIGFFIGCFSTRRIYRKNYKHLLDLMPGVVFENRLLVQVVLALFPTASKEIQVFVKKNWYKVYKEKGDIKYIQATT